MDHVLVGVVLFRLRTLLDEQLLVGGGTGQLRRDVTDLLLERANGRVLLRNTAAVVQAVGHFEEVSDGLGGRRWVAIVHRLHLELRSLGLIDQGSRFYDDNVVVFGRNLIVLWNATSRRRH